MPHAVKQLAQVRENNTNAASAYSPASGVEAIIRSIVVCNTTASPVTYRIFVDDDGTTYNQSTALFYDVSLPANTSTAIEVRIAMDNQNGNIAVQNGTANGITFTLFGEEFTT